MGGTACLLLNYLLLTALCATVHTVHVGGALLNYLVQVYTQIPSTLLVQIVAQPVQSGAQVHKCTRMVVESRLVAGKAMSVPSSTL